MEILNNALRDGIDEAALRTCEWGFRRKRGLDFALLELPFTRKFSVKLRAIELLEEDIDGPSW